MELFRKDGHLSDEGLRAVLGGSLTELESLEAAEHLSFCDDCLVRYTCLLEGCELLQPQAPLSSSVLHKLGRKARTIFFGKITKIAVAAVMAVALWSTGTFTVMAHYTTPPSPKPEVRSEAPHSMGESLNQAVNSVNQFFSGLFTPTEQKDTPAASSGPAQGSQQGTSPQNQPDSETESRP